MGRRGQCIFVHQTRTSLECLQNFECHWTLVFHCRCIWQCTWCLQGWQCCLKPSLACWTSGVYSKAIGMCKSQTSIPSNAWRFWIYTGRNSKCCQKWCNQNECHLQTQVGNPDGEDKPNKKFYDPRVRIRAAEGAMIKRVNESFKFLNAANSYV